MSPKKPWQKKDDPAMAPPDAPPSADQVRHGVYGRADADHEAGEPTGAGNDAVGVAAAPERSELPEDQEELRAQIEDTRAELGDTVEALSAKADVKAQAKEKVDETKAQAKDKVEQGKEQLRKTQGQAQVKLGEVGEQAKENQTPLAAGFGTFVALLLLGFLLRKRGSR